MGLSSTRRQTLPYIAHLGSYRSLQSPTDFTDEAFFQNRFVFIYFT